MRLLVVAVCLLVGCQSTQFPANSSESSRPLESGLDCGGEGQKCCQLTDGARSFEFCLQAAPCVNQVCQAPACGAGVPGALGYCEYAGRLLSCCDAELTCSASTKTCQGTKDCQSVAATCLVHAECCLGSHCEDFRCVADDNACVAEGSSCDAAKGGADCCPGSSSTLACLSQTCQACTWGGRVPTAEKPCCFGLSEGGSTCRSCASPGHGCQEDTDCCSGMSCVYSPIQNAKACSHVAKPGNLCYPPFVVCPSETPLCYAQLDGPSRCEKVPPDPCYDDLECDLSQGKQCCLVPSVNDAGVFSKSGDRSDRCTEAQLHTCY